MKTRRAAMPMLMGPALAGPLAAAGAKKLPDFTWNASEATVVKETFGTHNKYFEGATDQLKLLVAGSVTLDPGQTPHPPHKHEEEEIMLITSGTGIIGVNAKDKKVAPGSMMYCAAQQMHDIRNTGKTPLTFFYYKWKA